MHASQYGYKHVHVVVNLHLMLAFMSPQQPADVLDNPALPGKGKGRKSVSRVGQSNPSPS